MFRKILRKSMNTKTIKRVNYFKEINKEDILFEDVMIDKYGDEVYLITTYDELGLGIIYIFSRVDEKVLFTVNENNLTIGDIRIFKNRNRGIGSKCIDIIDRFAEYKNISRIEGNMHSENDEHRKIQIHFYSKNGFKIKGDKIIKVLD